MPKGGLQESWKGIIYKGISPSDRNRKDEFKLRQLKFRSDIRKKFFTLRVMRHLNREAVDGPSLEVFKARLDGIFHNLV